MLTREVLRAVRQIVGAVELAGMDIVEVSPPYDQAETTAMAANRAALEAISALAVKRRDGGTRALGGLTIEPSALDRPDAATAAALARLYDLDLVDDPGDLDLYLALAGRADGPILELAVGTGRLAIPLAEAGHAVTGVDLDPAMLDRARARRRSGTAGEDRLTLVEADVVGLRLPDAGRGSASRSSRSTRCSSCRPAPPSARPCGRWPTTSPRAAWRSSTCGCRTPTDLARFDGRIMPRLAATRSGDRAPS